MCDCLSVFIPVPRSVFGPSVRGVVFFRLLCFLPIPVLSFLCCVAGCSSIRLLKLTRLHPAEIVLCFWRSDCSVFFFFTHLWKSCHVSRKPEIPMWDPQKKVPPSWSPFNFFFFFVTPPVSSQKPRNKTCSCSDRLCSALSLRSLDRSFLRLLAKKNAANILCPSWLKPETSCWVVMCVSRPLCLARSLFAHRCPLTPRWQSDTCRLHS